MPTRSPTGREVRTLLNGVPSSWVGGEGWSGLVGTRGRRRRLGAGGRGGDPVRQRQEALGERRTAVGPPADHQDRVVAGDGAEDVVEAGPVERRGEELGGPGRRPQQGEVRGRV